MPGPTTLVIGLLFISWIHATLLSTTQAQVHHATPESQLRRRPAKANAYRPTIIFAPTYDWKQQEYVKAHNDLRQKVGVPPLRWHSVLSNFSQIWATQLQSTCHYRNHSHGKFGENTFWSLYKEFSPADVVKKWFSEQAHFDHTSHLCKCVPETDECECGHYLNVIWKTTQWIGCSDAVYCDDAKGVIVVCQYDPPGNFKGVNPLNPSPVKGYGAPPSINNPLVFGSPLPIGTPRVSGPSPPINNLRISGASHPNNRWKTTN